MKLEVTSNPRLQILAGMLALTVLAFVIALPDIAAGGFSWSDAPLHAMDGVFLHDLVRAWPSESWQQWAQEYYLRYPCLGIIVYYPPLFAAVEALVFLVLGISVLAARLTVLLFVIGSLWLLFLLGRELFGTAAGLIGAALALVTPAGVIWSRQVMLEWPATFWIVLALLAYVRFDKTQHWRWGLLIAVGCVGAYLTKQTAAFVLPVILVHAFVFRKWPMLRRPAFWLPMSVGIAAIAAYGAATAGMNQLAGDLLAGSPPWRHLVSIDHWSWYLLRLPNIVGWPVLLILVISLAVLLRSSGLRQRAALPAAWAIGWWLISTAIHAKEARYFFFAVPALTLLAGAGLAELALRQSIVTAPSSATGGGHGTTGGSSASAARAANGAAGAFNLPLLLLCSAAAVLAGVLAITTHANRLADTKPTVDSLSQTEDADLVLVDAVRDGQFVFDVRTNPQARGRIIPLRASKLLYSRAARTRYRYAQHVESPADILALLDRLAIGYVVLEDRLPTAGAHAQADEDTSWDTPPRLMLRELVGDSDKFEKVYEQPLRCADPIWDDVRMVTYRYKHAKKHSSDTVTIPVPAMGKDFELRIPPRP